VKMSPALGGSAGKVVPGF